MHCPAPIRISLTLLVSAMALAACQQSSQPAPQEQESAPAGPEAKPGLSVNGGVLVLPVVSGRPGAVYFKLENGSEKATELAAVHIDGALRAEMHETRGDSMAQIEKLVIGPGETIEFARGGKHVMAFDLDEDLKVGGSTELTLVFADGDKLSAPIRIEAMGGTARMDHGDTH